MKRSIAQQLGSLGQHMVKVEIEKSQCWIARDQNEDFGIDLEMELAIHEVSGKIIKVQIKSHQQVEQVGDFVYERLPKSFLRYAYECRIPVILIVASISSGEMWYAWLQKWLYDTNNKVNIYDELISQSIQINIHKHSLLKDDLNGQLISIATWENETQKLITLYDLANLSLKLYDDNLSSLLFTYIEALNKENTFSYPDQIIDKVIEIGASIWATPEGNKRTQQLFEFIRNNGNKLKREHISKLVIRGDSYSRTGINALGVLYSSFPRYAQSLLLPEFFKGFQDPRLHYYCVLRERCLADTSFFWVTPTANFRVGDFTIDDPDVLAQLMNKMANRGDSAILDYIVYKPIGEK
ncbi:DUF4365 domain-containing protein [Flavihumibacter sp. CACIAM 22H1]|uniref:DUF4365 domain-containing protein n=1 Tax=Flavihumibacter sp. CACIAM 22H1 TaxID=1812911 RepID=UPI0007A7E047|nr:DUF4365 domain-containing protein [Flavihumibacter sp. CACIAM 22H1]KYP13496.1 MAG: hypothetical protein A1D16_12780 [Flavihumibacter sp. CACIAM 22H1]